MGVRLTARQSLGLGGGAQREGLAGPEDGKRRPTCRDHLSTSWAAATGGHGSWSSAVSGGPRLVSFLRGSEQLTALL